MKWVSMYKPLLSMLLKSEGAYSILLHALAVPSCSFAFVISCNLCFYYCFFLFCLFDVSYYLVFVPGFGPLDFSMNINEQQ